MRRLLLLALALLGGYAAWRRFSSGPTGQARTRDASPLAPTGPGEEPQVQSFMTVARPEPSLEAEIVGEAEPAGEPGQAEPGEAAAYVDGPHGPGSARPASDGSGPQGWTIKGNADSKLFHTSASPWYGRTVAEVWFQDEDAARAAGFQHWDRKQR